MNIARYAARREKLRELMSREGLVGREPVLEIGDAYWSLRPGETISKEACLKLLSRIVQEKG